MPLEEACRKMSLEEACHKLSEIKLYKRRWLILGIFISFSFIASVQWAQYVSIAHLVSTYYHVTSDAIDWTSVVFMVAYILMIFPALWLLDKLGLRQMMIISGGGMCLGSWIKLYAVYENGFTVLLIGQSIVASFQILAFGFAARIAAVWFGPNEVSLAYSLAIFGDLFGTAIGYILPSLIVCDDNTIETIRNGLYYLNLIVAIYCTVVIALIFLLFSNAPAKPPGAAQALQKLSIKSTDVFVSLKKLMKKDFLTILVSYSILIASFNTISVLLNQIVISNFPQYGAQVGVIGFLMQLLGIVGVILGGWFLDKSHLYKEMMVFICAGSFMSMLAITFLLKCGNFSLVFGAVCFFGFFVVTYYATGTQMTIEHTYPISEGITAAILMFGVQLLGVVFTNLYRLTFNVAGDLYANLAVTVLLFIGTVLIATVSSGLKRQAVEDAAKENDTQRINKILNSTAINVLPINS